MDGLKGRTAVVTGASRGVGRASGKRLAGEGMRVVAVAGSGEALESLARDRPGSVIAAAADIRDPEAVNGVRDLALERLGRVDILVNNAGLAHFGLIEDISPEQWDEMFDVNLKGAYLFCRAFVPHMKERRSGHIINIASVAGLVTFPRGAGYCASKWGMIALTETLMQELKPYELKVSVICPGSVKTDFGGTPPRDYSLRPEDVAAMVATVAAQPQGVILNQVVMRPLVPQPPQAGAPA